MKAAKVPDVFELDPPTGSIFTVRGGRLVRVEGLLSRETALEAAGLPA